MSNISLRFQSHISPERCLGLIIKCQRYLTIKLSSLRVGYYKYFQLLFDVVEQVGKTGNKDKVGKRATNIGGGEALSLP